MSFLKSYISLLALLKEKGAPLVDLLYHNILSLDASPNLRVFLLQLLKDLNISGLKNDILKLVDVQDMTFLLPVLEDLLVSDSPELIHSIEAVLPNYEIDFVITLFKEPFATQFSEQSIETLIDLLIALPAIERSDLKEEIEQISLPQFYISLVNRFVKWLQQDVTDTQLMFFSDLLPLCTNYLQPLCELLESDDYWKRIFSESFEYDFLLEAIYGVDLVLESGLHLSPMSHILRFVLFQYYNM